MEPRLSAQDVERCVLCDDMAPMFCQVCHKNLCKNCVEIHFADSSKVHKIVSLKQYLTTIKHPKCSKHPTKQCELYCEQCDIPICVQCISSEEHPGHSTVDISKVFEQKRTSLQADLNDLENIVYPKYREIAYNISVQKTELIKNSQNLTKSFNEQGEQLHRKLDSIVKDMKSHAASMQLRHAALLNKQETDISRTISEMKGTVLALKELLDSKESCPVFQYKSRIAEFRNLPPKLKVSLPKFTFPEETFSELQKQFGSLSGLSFTEEEQDFTINRSLLDVPQLITCIDTGYDYLYSATCLNDTEIWTRANDNIMRLLNIKGELKKSFQTKSGNRPRDITVTKSEDLVYIDAHDRTVNIIKNTQIEELIDFQGWRPRSLCSTSCDDLLIIAYSDDDDQTGIFRFRGRTEKQRIHIENERNTGTLFSPGGIKFIIENKNLDICVADCGARKVVVVNQAGKLRFTYTCPPSATKGPFDPVGITADNQSRILIADCDNNRIHILDQDGQFLRYINNCNLDAPWGLCVDTRDNLFVAEWKTSKVKKIQYCMQFN